MIDYHLKNLVPFKIGRFYL